ncbi:MAG TPA: serine hydrolase domain-containing protein [Candidatus Elarobacter sp.]|jgi:CubicO group peptidase (beta-lactamase class C family)
MRRFRIATAAFAALFSFAAGTLLVPATGVSAQPVSPPPASAAVLTPEQIAAIDKIAATAIDRKATPSVAIGVAKNGKLVFAKAYGHRNLDDKVAADADTMYAIGSNTKQFTAAAILLLRDAGKLDVDAPVSRYLPNVPHGREVTIRNLLTHTGGYAEFTELPDVDRLAARPATNEEILDTVVNRPLGFKPGTKWQYSNTGYVMLATVIEHVTGTSYADFLRTRIFEPLGMMRTRYEDQSLIETNRATGYTRFAMGEQEHESHLDYSWFSGAGAIESTLADLETWNNAIDRGTLLSAASRDMMHTSFKLADGTDTHYGFGLFLQALPGGKHAVLHGGDTTGFGTQDARFVEDGVDVIVLTNQEPASYNAIMGAVYAAVVPAPPKPLPTATPAPSGPAPGNPPPAQAALPAAATPKPAASPTAIPYSKPEIDALARRWLDDAIAGNIDFTKLRASTRAGLRLPRIQAALRDLARFGDRTYTLINVDRRAPSSAYQYLLRTPKRTLLYIFAIDDDGLIGGGDVYDPNPLAPDPPPSPAPPAAPK